MRAVPLAVAIVAAAVPAANAQAARDRMTEVLSARLFPLLDTIGRDAGTGARLKAHRAAAAALAARAARWDACADDATCIATAAVWSDAELQTLAAALARGAPPASAPDDGVAAGVARELRGLNAIVQVYALGATPRYPKIDGPEVTPDSDEGRTRLRAAIALSRTPRAGSAQAVDRSIELALALLDANGRTDAAGFEPVDAGPNAAPTRRAAGIDWSRYRYSAVVLTGIGPEVADMPLSPGGAYHVRLAANRFARGDVPFIIVSGGRAHPRATPFNEAVEMRRALIDRYGVPADAIVIEPYARHTTTNLRNAVRRLAALGAPLDKDALIVCNAEQSRTIESAAFVERNRRELGYQPGTIGARHAPTELVFRPARAALRIDPLDPLDP